MKNRALFSSTDKSKTLKCRLLQFLFGALRVRSQKQNKTGSSMDSCYSGDHTTRDHTVYIESTLNLLRVTTDRVSTLMLARSRSSQNPIAISISVQVIDLAYTIKPAYVATSIKGSPVLSSHLSGSLEPKYTMHSANVPVLRGHLS